MLCQHLSIHILHSVCAVQWGVCSTPWDVQYTGGISLSTLASVQYTEGHHEYTRGYHGECGRYHEYIRGCSVYWRDTISTLGGYHDEYERKS